MPVCRVGKNIKNSVNIAIQCINDIINYSMCCVFYHICYLSQYLTVKYDVNLFLFPFLTMFLPSLSILSEFFNKKIFYTVKGILGDNTIPLI